MSLIAHESQLHPEAEFEAEDEWEFEDEFEGELEDEFEDEGEEFLSTLGGLAKSLLGEGEYEYEDFHPGRPDHEDEWEYELERMANPQARVYPDAVMAHLGHAAAMAESEAEAEAFIGALVPLATSLVRSAAPAIMRSAPQLVKGLARVTKTLRRNPATRPLVRALPTVLKQTTRSLARQVGRGRPITGRTVLRTLGRQTSAVLGSAPQRRRAYRHSCALDRSYHRHVAHPPLRGGNAGARGHGGSGHVPGLPAGGRPVYGSVPRSRGRSRGSRMSIAWIPVPALCGDPRRRR